jgi:hypothetical protein
LLDITSDFVHLFINYQKYKIKSRSSSIRIFDALILPLLSCLLYVFFGAEKFLPIYLCIKVFYIKLQNRIRIDGNSINSSNIL